MDATSKIIANMAIVMAFGVMENHLRQEDPRRILIRTLQAAVLAAINTS
jgi:hypothetical protein